MDTKTLYWLTRLPEIEAVLPGTGSIALSIILGLFWIGFRIASELGDATAELQPLLDGLRQFALILLVVGSLGNVGRALIPDKEAIAVILAGSYLTNNEEISKLPSNMAKALNTFMEQYQIDNKQSKPTTIEEK